MKKFNISALILILIVIFLSACGGGTQSSTSNTPQDNSSGEEKKKYAIKTVYAYPSASTPGNYFNWFNEELQKRSDGRLSLEIYSDAQLMPAIQEIPAILNGEVDMTITANGVLSSILPDYYVYEVPLLFKHDPKDVSVHIEDLRAFYENEEGGKVIERKMEEKGLKIISQPITSEPAIFFTRSTDQVITDVQSIKGLKMRIIGGQIVPKVLEEVGASGVPIAAAELGTALQQGVVDGSVSPAAYAMDVKLPVKTATFFPLATQSNPVIISKKKFDSLPADLKEILLEVSKELEAYSDNFMKERYPKVLNELEAANVQVHFPTDKEFDEWKKVLIPVWSNFTKMVEDGKKLIEAAESE